MEITLSRTSVSSSTPGSKLYWCGNDERVFRAAADVHHAVEELRHIIDLLRHGRDLAYLRLLLKLYNVAWITLSDVLAALINETLDLGYPDGDLGLGVILGNRHVKATGIDRIVARHSKSIDYQRFRKMRNDVVHRGRLADEQLDSLKQSETTMMLDAAFMAATTDKDVISAAISDTFRDSGLDDRVSKFAATRATELVTHLRHTLDLLTEIDTKLAEVLTTKVPPGA